MNMKTYHAEKGLHFIRTPDGGVRIVKTNGPAPEDGGVVEFDQVIDAGTWTSAVLSMSFFGERPGDWHQWMAHHNGEKCLIGGR